MRPTFHRHRHRLAVLVAAAAGCTDETVRVAGASVPDLATARDLLSGDGGVPPFAELTFTGCAALDVPAGRPRCTGPAPLVATLVPLTSPGIDTFLWTVPGAMPSSSKAPSPEVSFRLPGSYPVALVAGGPGGSTTAEGDVVVTPAATGAACAEAAQCSPGYNCLCNPPGDGGSACPGALAQGLCTRSCDGIACGSGEVCVDLSRSAGSDAMPPPSPWRHPFCVPPCSLPGDCPAGLLCRERMALAPGAKAGGAWSWVRACYPPALGDPGAACIDPQGQLAPTSCFTGDCAPLGARGLCTLGCAAAPCPSGTACATFTGDPGHPLCLPRCDGSHPCADPLLDCQTANPAGAFGFAVPTGEPKDATFCAPRRCAKPADCAPAGSCSGPDGGVDFCERH